MQDKSNVLNIFCVNAYEYVYKTLLKYFFWTVCILFYYLKLELLKKNFLFKTFFYKNYDAVVWGGD